MMLSGLAFVFLIARPAAAVGLDEAIRDYLQRSPQIHGQTTLMELSQGDRWRRFLVREPSVQFTDTDDNSGVAYGMSLTTSFPGKSLAYMEFDRIRAENERRELRSRTQEATRLIAQTYLDCASSRALADLQRQAVEDFETLATSLRRLYESGHSTQAEKIGAELQFRQTNADLQASLNHAEGMCRKWHEVYGGADPEAIPDDLAPATVQQLGDDTADQARARGQMQLAEANQDLRWWAEAPDITWAVARNHYIYQPASPSGKVWTTSYSVSLTLPLLFPFSESVEAKRQMAQSALDRDTARVQLAAADADREEAAREFARDQKRLHELRESDIPLAEALIDSTYAAYKIGKLGYAELILSRKTLLDLKTQEIQIRIASIGARLRCLETCQPTESRR